MRKALTTLIIVISATLLVLPHIAQAGGVEINQRLAEKSDAYTSEVAPAFGTDSESILALDAFGFLPFDATSGDAIRADIARRYCTQNCGLLAQVTLPTGVLVTAIELDAYDNDTNGWVEAYFFMCPKGAYGCTIVQSLGTGVSETPGVIQIAQPFMPSWLIENQYNTYIVEAVINGSTSDTALRGIRIFYKLHISPAPAFATFSDVPVGSFWHQYVEALAASGITTGYGDSTFRPDNPVTRGQMAAFLSRALGLHWPN